MALMRDADEAELRAGLASDLDSCFERLVLDYQNRLYGFGLRLTGSPRDAEEIAQDSFVRAYRALCGYPPEQTRGLAIRPWLLQIALNVYRNRVRKKRPATISLEQGLQPREEGAAEIPEPADEGAETPENAAERAEEREELAKAVAALPERYRAAVVLRFVEDLTYAEVASVLGQPVGTVKANVHRGVGLLRARLAQREG